MINLEIINDIIRRNLEHDMAKGFISKNIHIEDYKLTDEKVCAFIARNYQCLESHYLTYATKDNPQLTFSALKNVYLLDKEVRMYIFTIIEEIEVFLKSYLRLENNIKLSSYGTYNKIYIDITKYKKMYKKTNPKKTDEEIEESYKIAYSKEQVVTSIEKMKKTPENIFKFSFADISKIINAIYTGPWGNGPEQEKNLRPLLEHLKYGTHDKLRYAIRNLSSLRNSIAHHDSIIKLIEIKKRKNHMIITLNYRQNGTQQTLRDVLESIHKINQNVRQDDNPNNSPKNKLQRLEDIIKQRTKTRPNLRGFLGYKIKDFDAISDNSRR